MVDLISVGGLLLAFFLVVMNGVFVGLDSSDGPGTPFDLLRKAGHGPR